MWSLTAFYNNYWTKSC